MDFIVEMPEFTEFEKQIQAERDFFKYMELLKKAKNEYIIIIVAGDTPAGPLFTPEHSAAMMSALGLRLNMVQAYRQPYVAIIDGGEVIYEQTSQDLTKAITVDADFGEHKLFIHSGGFDCADKFGWRAVLKVDDNCHYGSRGLNFYTFNSNKGYMADFFRWETFEDKNAEYPLHKPFLDAQEIFSAIENNSMGGGVA
ncbi:MAG: hypothetical protein J6M62_08640 [Selenomonadaceae bacterium]|nr:hypothetical protein [Selenomonadaceae bacterium]